MCDSFVYIPQYGMGTASLNVTVAASIILHQFALWAEYEEAPRQGVKFVVEQLSQRTRPRGGWWTGLTLHICSVTNIYMYVIQTYVAVRYLISIAAPCGRLASLDS